MQQMQGVDPYNQNGNDQQKPYRLNSQQNKRGNGKKQDGIAAGPEGYGRPLTKHQPRTRVSNSQGGIRKRPQKQPFSANPNHA